MRVSHCSLALFFRRVLGGVNVTGLHHAMLLTHIHTRLLHPGLAQLTDPNPPTPSRLRTAAHNYQRALDQLTQEAGLAA